MLLLPPSLENTGAGGDPGDNGNELSQSGMVYNAMGVSWRNTTTARWKNSFGKIATYIHHTSETEKLCIKYSVSVYSVLHTALH